MKVEAPSIQAFPMADATPSQQQVMGIVKKAGESRSFIYWMGGVRAGKSFGSAIAFMEHQRYRKSKKYLILCYTQTQALEIYGPYFETIGEAMGFNVRVVRGANARIEVLETGNSFLIKGADKAGKDKSIQGLTMEGLLADEVVLLNRDALHQAEARVSGKGALRIYTSNKSNPYHWTTKYYVERINKGEIFGNVIDCGLADNPHVSEEYSAERASEFTGSTLRRFIDNEFTLDGDPIFDAGMGMYAEGGARKSAYLCIYGHPKGYEVLQCWLVHGKAGVHLNLWKAHSFKHYGDLKEVIQGKQRAMVNSTQPVTARWLRRRGVPTRAYLEEDRSNRVEILRRACADGRVWLNPDCDELLEAVKTYHSPGKVLFPILYAVEAMGEVLRSYVTM